jgi:hypothetical protein
MSAMKRFAALLPILCLLAFLTPAHAQLACPNPFAAAPCTAITATATGTTGAITVTGTITGTMNFGYPTLALGATVPNNGSLDETFQPCIPASAINTAIVVNGPALGAGATLVTASAWGYQL